MNKKPLIPWKKNGALQNTKNAGRPLHLHEDGLASAGADARGAVLGGASEGILQKITELNLEVFYSQKIILIIFSTVGSSVNKS